MIITKLTICEMFTRQLEKINHLLGESRDERSSLADSCALVTSRYRTHSTRRTVSTPKPKYSSEIGLIQQALPKKYAAVLEGVFRGKCRSLNIDFNASNWETFLKAFLAKNQLKQGQICNETLNLNGFALADDSLPAINEFLALNPALVVIKLNKNTLNPNHLHTLRTLRQLSLGNCRLGNDLLEQLFSKLQSAPIEKLSLSSPELKNRNQLTKYGALIELIQSSRTLHTLELANMDIRPDCAIIENCRNTALKHLDLSDNSGVKGISPSLLSLTLARNAIALPFSYPMLPNDLLVLALPSNPIPAAHFRDFLKFSYFSNLQELIIDHIKLDGELISFQLFLEQSPTLRVLSMADCSLTQAGFLSLAHGIKHSRALEVLNLSSNRILNEKIADYVAHMVQGSSLKEVKLRHCEIKDALGYNIFRNIRKSKTIEKLDLTGNLLGDKTAKTICHELKLTKTLTVLLLEDNIIKYADLHEINSYLDSNRFLSAHHLHKEYQKLQQANSQIAEAAIIINSETEKIAQLERETEALHLEYLTKFRLDNQERKRRLRNDIYSLRDSENQLMTDITLLQALPSISELNSMESRRESFLSDHPTFNHL